MIMNEGAGDFVYPAIHTACLKFSAEEVTLVCTCTRLNRGRGGENWLLGALFFVFFAGGFAARVTQLFNFSEESCDGAIWFHNGMKD